jgi:uncharacterized protein (TIGR00369 family)
VTTTRRWGPIPPEASRTQDGLSILRSIIAGDIPAPPITNFLPFTLTAAEPGAALFEGTPGVELYNPMGTVHGGFAMTLLDSAMTCAVMTALQVGEGCTTVETKVNFVRPILASTGLVRAEGRLVHAGARVAIADGRLVDAGGRLYAHGTSTCLRFPLPA